MAAYAVAWCLHERYARFLRCADSRGSCNVQILSDILSHIRYSVASYDKILRQVSNSESLQIWNYSESRQRELFEKWRSVVITPVPGQFVSVRTGLSYPCDSSCDSSCECAIWVNIQWRNILRHDFLGTRSFGSAIPVVCPSSLVIKNSWAIPNLWTCRALVPLRLCFCIVMLLSCPSFELKSPSLFEARTVWTALPRSGKDPPQWL